MLQIFLGFIIGTLVADYGIFAGWPLWKIVCVAIAITIPASVLLSIVVAAVTK